MVKYVGVFLVVVSNAMATEAVHIDVYDIDGELTGGFDLPTRRVNPGAIAYDEESGSDEFLFCDRGKIYRHQVGTGVCLGAVAAPYTNHTRLDIVGDTVWAVVEEYDESFPQAKVVENTIVVRYDYQYPNTLIETASYRFYNTSILGIAGEDSKRFWVSELLWFDPAIVRLFKYRINGDGDLDPLGYVHVPQYADYALDFDRGQAYYSLDYGPHPEYSESLTVVVSNIGDSRATNVQVFVNEGYDQFLGRDDWRYCEGFEISPFFRFNGGITKISSNELYVVTYGGVPRNPLSPDAQHVGYNAVYFRELSGEE